MRVLICDDIAMMRKTMVMFLDKAGQEVVAECSSGREAIAKYKETRPDVCLLDIAMPDMDGIATLKNIKTIDPEAKVIMCTAKDDAKSIEDASEMGVIDFVEKPFSPGRLNEALSKVLL